MFNIQLRVTTRYCLLPIAYCLLTASCSIQKQISRTAQQLVIKDSSLLSAHIGISIFNPAKNKYWYNYHSDKYFVPASNTKIPTCYAAMKYLGDSLVGLRYQFIDNNLLLIQPSADPTFLYHEFKNQPVYDFLNNTTGLQITMTNPRWKEDALGLGWSWNDYEESYMAERSFMPIYGNVAKFTYNAKGFIGSPKYFNLGNEIVSSDLSITLDSIDDKYNIRRDKASNNFRLEKSMRSINTVEIPFVTKDAWIGLLIDTFKKTIVPDFDLQLEKNSKVIHSQPTDSLLKPMMHRSDNFFAEQALLMVSNELLGFMNDEKITDTLLKTDFRDLPQQPRWVDGSGLSRYNLFTPEDFVAILSKMKNKFGMERIKTVFPTGNTGTLVDYYKADSGYIFAKTGTLSGVAALSGYLYTGKNKLLIFSVLINNHQSVAATIRRAVEKFIEQIRKRY